MDLETLPAPAKTEPEQALPLLEEVPVEPQPAPTNGGQSLKQRAKRLLSLDAFRGFTVLGMLLVNNSALDTATPPTLKHAGWNGGTHFADMIFPWFLFIVGVAIPYSYASFQKRGLPAWRYDLRIIGRAATLVLLGCLVNSSMAKSPMFDLGVLQIIGLAYLFGALFYELPLRRRLVLAGGLLTAHWFAIRFLPIPGVGIGIFTEDTNVINHLNRTYLEPYHLRGIISVVPTSALVLIGTAIGDLLRNQSLRNLQKVGYLLGTGVLLVATGWIWNLDLPFNKPVWTASYILFAAGWGALLLGLFYLLIDANGWRRWAFLLVVPGTNAIFAFVVPILTKTYILNLWTWKLPDGSHQALSGVLLGFCKSHAGLIVGGWIYTIAFIAFWWLILFWLYRKQVFLRV